MISLLKDSLNVMLRIISCTLFAALLLMAVPASAQTPDPWTARDRCVFAMPYIGHAVKPGNSGLVNEILTAVFEYDDIELQHVAMPYNRALEALRTGEVDCTLDIENNQREVLQGSLAMARYDLSTAYLRATPFEGVKSLADQRVAYLHGFGLDNFLPVSFTPQQVYDLSSAFHMLDRGHVQFVLGDSLLLKDAIYESRLPSYEFVISKLKSFEVRPIFAKTDRGRRLRDIYDREMRKLIATGDFTEIMERHGLSEQTIKTILKINQGR